MSATLLQKVGEGQFKLTGDIGFKTASALLEAGRVQFAGQQSVRVDMAEVRSTDSAGLALMIEWTRHAIAAGQELKFTSVPAQLKSLAEISDVEELLPLA